MNFKKTIIALATIATVATPITALADTMYVKAPSGLNIRTEGSVESEKLSALPYGAEIDVIETTDENWAKITYEGQEAYMSAEWLSADKPEPKKVEKKASTVKQSSSSDSGNSSSTSGSYYGKCRITFYCPCAKCCSRANQPTASGVMPSAGRTVAMGGVPFGTKVSIDGHVYTVEDRGVSGKSADIFVNSHSEALQRGMYYSDVYIVG